VFRTIVLVVVLAFRTEDDDEGEDENEIRRSEALPRQELAGIP
jgi:hypothetical protein